MSISLWNIQTGAEISILIERSKVGISLPVVNGLEGIEVQLISGSLPRGTRIEGTNIVGTAYEVTQDTIYTGVLRANWQGFIDERTIKITVTGPDSPEWRTDEGLLPVGNNNTYFVLDSSVIDFQLFAEDPDISAGDELEYFIAEGDGELPPGISLTADGRLTGVTEPLLSLDKRFQGGGYDTMPYGDFPIDYAVLSSNGYGSFFYDTTVYGFSEPTRSLRKLNRYYPFAVTVTDGDSFARREFNIYVVGDDFLRADNTVMQASTGVFTADNTHIRTPVWVTPNDLGFRRANNYTTLYFDIIDPPTLSGAVVYTLEDVNDDGSPSVLPPGLSLDSQTGEVTGRLPYQPAITQDYKFTIRATRFTGDIETLEIFGTFYEDVLLGADSFKVYKLDLTGNLDGINDLRALVERDILINKRLYKVINVDDSNPDYDVIFLDQTLNPNVSLLLSRDAKPGQNHIFTSRLDIKDKEKYQGRTLRFNENEKYSISNITPYIEYEIIQRGSQNDPLLPIGAPKPIVANQLYNLNDYAEWGIEVGGNGKIYKCIETHITTGQVNQDGLIVEVDGIVQVDFESNKWQLVANSISDLALDDQVAATKQALEFEFKGEAFIDTLEKSRWRIRIPSNAKSRIKSNIQNFFALSGDSSDIKVVLLRDNEDKIDLASNLNRVLNSGRNIGIALFQNDFFSENIAIADDTDEINVPSSAKTFSIKIIGEIDTTINWITDADLGTINANFLSTLKLEAETTVPDTEMIYRIVSGKLPNGITLNYRGEIVGSAKQYASDNELGLTTFDNKGVSWDGELPGDTTFDREYKFVVEARDRFNYSAITREFVLKVDDLDDTVYTDIVARPMLPLEKRQDFKLFTSDISVFEPNKIYRPGDPNFGIQNNLEMLVYAGIEAKSIDQFVAAAAKNHKKKKYILGTPKKAIAQEPGTRDTIYEVVYIPVIDPYESDRGKTNKKFKIKTGKKITADSIQYAGVDDETKTGLGYSSLPVYGRDIVKFVFAHDEDSLIIETRDGNIDFNVDNADFELDIRDGQDVNVKLEIGDSEPMRIRPTPANTIKADSDAIKVSDSKDQTKYISSIEHMRDNISSIGITEKGYLPLWMRTPQEGFAQLGYVSAIPICYCKPGLADDILLNIANNGYNFKDINFEIDRYIVKRSENKDQEQYILFANYQYNV